MACSSRIPVPVYHNTVRHCSMAAGISEMVNGTFSFVLPLLVASVERNGFAWRGLYTFLRAPADVYCLILGESSH
jgi:hypothetical protein